MHLIKSKIWLNYVINYGMNLLVVKNKPNFKLKKINQPRKRAKIKGRLIMLKIVNKSREVFLIRISRN